MLGATASPSGGTQAGRTAPVGAVLGARVSLYTTCGGTDQLAFLPGKDIRPELRKHQLRIPNRPYTLHHTN